MAQLVCKYRKGEEARWLSHLDVKRTLERAMRRANLPLALTQGHNPHPRISLGPPLGLGVTGEGELLAIHLETAMDPDRLKEMLNAQLPPGLQVTEAWALPTYRKKETFGEIDVAEYRVTVEGGPPLAEVAARVEALLARPEAVVQRGGERPERQVDVRPLILSLSAREAPAGRVELHMRLRTGSHGGARPQEVVDLLGLGSEECRVSYHRVGLYAGVPAEPRHTTGLIRRWGRTRRRE